MKKIFLVFCLMIFFVTPSFAWDWGWQNCEKKAVEKLLKSQIKYANRANFEKFIQTYDPQYVNADGFNLDVYSSLVKDIWATYENIKYGIDIKEILISGDEATVTLTETSFADIRKSAVYDGELISEAETVYYLKKNDGKWKVVSDKVLEETTTMLYGQAKGLKIKLTVPNNIEANKEYCATLEFDPPAEFIAIASIASDIVEYPQKPTEEIFRALPEDNILERLLTSNNKNANEYVVASIGLTKTSVQDLNLKLSLTGFGYVIKRVNVIPTKEDESNAKNE